MQFNIGLIGAGRIGAIHAANLAREPRVRLCAIADQLPAAAERLGAEHQVAARSVEAVLEDSEIHGIVIASSTDSHATLITRAAEAGKAIFCEKPIDLAVETATRCVDVLRSTKVPFLLGFNRRFDPHFAALKKRLNQGEIGNMEMLHITSRDPAPPPLSYVPTSGGMFKDMTIHDLDMARWLLGEEPAEMSVMASCLVDPAIGEMGDVDSAVLTLRTAGGRICVISNSRRADYGYDQRIEVLGSTGLLQAGNVRKTEVVLQTSTGRTADRIQYFFLERYAAAYAAEMSHFIDMLEGKTAPLVGADDGLKALHLAEAAMEAMRTGSTVKLAR